MRAVGGPLPDLRHSAQRQHTVRRACATGTDVQQKVAILLRQPNLQGTLRVLDLCYRQRRRQREPMSEAAEHPFRARRISQAQDPIVNCTPRFLAHARSLMACRGRADRDGRDLHSPAKIGYAHLTQIACTVGGGDRMGSGRARYRILGSSCCWRRLFVAGVAVLVVDDVVGVGLAELFA